MKKITILLPAYNEASSIPLLQEKMAEVAQETRVMNGNSSS